MPELTHSSDANAVVRAGGIAKKGAKTDAATTGDLVSKTFAHPALAGRVVVRLVEQSLDAAVDAEMGALGFAAAPGATGEGPAVIGRTRKRALGFPAWALVNHPNKARFALEVMKDFRKAATRAKTKPGHAKDAFMEVAKKLERSVPAFMPSYWEEVGRVFLGEDATMYASQSFEKARAAEREYKLAVDEDRRAAAYLEFTAAGAVPAKSLAGYADDLLSAFGGKEAEKRFVELNVHRIKAGVPPWTGMAKELAKVAKAAKHEGAEADFLREVLASPSLKQAPPDFWATYMPVLAKLAASSPEIKERALWLFPEPRGFQKFLPTWLAFLDEIGAVAAMETHPEAGRWATALTRFVSFSNEYGHRKEDLSEAYYALLARLAPRLRALGQPLALENYQRWGDDGEYSPDILEVGLSLDLPLAPPRGEDPSINLRDLFTKDPVRLAAHPAYGPLLVAAVGNQFGREEFEARAKGKTGLVAARKAFLMKTVEELHKGALPTLKDALQTVTRKTSPATFTEFPEAQAVLDKVDVARALARSVRGGLFDELAWPEYEAAIASLAGPKVEIQLHGSMQHPIVFAGRKVIVFEGKTKLRELDLPASVKEPSSLLYLDGDVVAGWYDRKASGYQAVWFSDAKNPFACQVSQRGMPEELPVPDGGVTLGGAAIHKGDRPEKLTYSPFASDGKTFWHGRVAPWKERLKLTELDPKTGAQGRTSWPEFVREASEKADGLLLHEVQILPAPHGVERSLFGLKDGMVGVYTRKGDGEETTRWELVRIDGRTHTGDWLPSWIADWPGKETPQRLSVSNAWSNENSDEYIFKDEEGEVTGNYGADEWTTAGFSILPREAWLHCMEVRDLASSRALREVSDEAMAKVLAVAADTTDGDEDEKLVKTIEAVKTHLPGVTNEVIRGGVAKVAKVAAERVAELAALLDRGAGGSDTLSDDAVEAAFPSLDTEGYEDGFFATDLKAVVDGFLDKKVTKLTASRICWERHIETMAKLACYVASRKTTTDAVRHTLVELLAALVESRVFGLTLTRAELAVKTDSPFLTRPKEKDVWLATEGDTVYFARMPDVDEDEPTQKVYVLVHGDKLAVPKDATLTTHTTVTVQDDSAFVRTFLAELAAKGPVPYDPAAAALVATETSLTAAEAAMLFAGLPNFTRYHHDFLGKETREALDLKVTDANKARDKLRALSSEQRDALLVGTTNVVDPLAYWAPPAAEESVARALIRTAKALFGKSVVLREELVETVEKELSLDIPVRKALTLVLTAADGDNALLKPRKGPVAWNEIGRSGDFFSSDVVESVAKLIPFFANELPVGDEYRQKVPELYRAVLKGLDDPDMVLSLGGRDEEDAAKRVIILDQIGGKTFKLPARRGGDDREGRDNGIILAADDGYNEVELAVHTAKIRTDRAAIEPYITRDREENTYGTSGASAAFYLLSKECEELVKRIEKSPVPAGSFEANPLLAAKGTVKKLAEAAGIDEEAAALYLQMLALPNPTKKTILRFNGWKPAQYDSAAATLVKKKLCIEGKRERAGRDIFLPGSWEKKSRGVSLETYKLALYKGSFDESVVSSPMHVLYDKAFTRWSSGDKPSFVDVTKKKTS